MRAICLAPEPELQKETRPTTVLWASQETCKSMLILGNGRGARIGWHAFGSRIVYTLHDVDIGLSACYCGIGVVCRSNRRRIETLVRARTAWRPIDVVAHDRVRRRGWRVPTEINLVGRTGSAQRKGCRRIGGRVARDRQLAGGCTSHGRSKLHVQVQRLTGIQSDRKA